ncbi:response regulator [Massilia sp. Se16.2.3]|uniref:response regulator n=1 Tax=Massilia sp. Se16.2.3 TaxID=2709303 RepID=UPI0016002176|nr:response regulator [Massilia sp. Se16.2.3]QNB00903.1 response regulator [Massilia sp. Se16.2.3]
MPPGTEILLTSGHLPDGVFDVDIELLPKPYGRAQLARAVRARLLDGGHLPGAPAPLPAAAAACMPAEPSFGPGTLALETPDGRSILVVEDDQDTRELACELLCALGHAASGSGSAEQALALLRERPVDILFTDLNLPGMSGIELATRAIALQPTLKVILASGEGGTIALPADSPIMLLPKPYDLLQLQVSIAELTPVPPALCG